MKDVMIFDNFLEETKVKKLKDYFIKNQNDLTWIYFTFINYTKEGEPTTLSNPSMVKTKNNDGFVINLIRQETPISDDIREIIEEIKNKTSKILDVEIKHTIRIKVNLNKSQSLNEKEIYEGIHIDSKSEHLTFIYYVNTNDGYTILYESDKKTIKDKINCVENRLVVFNGLTPHVGVPSTNDDKCLINFNVIKKTSNKLI